MLARLSISAKLYAIVSFLFLVIAFDRRLCVPGDPRDQHRELRGSRPSGVPSVRWIGEMRTRSGRLVPSSAAILIVEDADRADPDKNLGGPQGRL